MVHLFGGFQDPAAELDKMAAAVRRHRSVSGVLRRWEDGRAISFRFLAPDCMILEGDLIRGRVMANGTQAFFVPAEGPNYLQLDPIGALSESIAIPVYSTLLSSQSVDSVRLFKMGAMSGTDGTVRIDFNLIWQKLGSTLGNQRIAISDYWQLFLPRVGGMDLTIDSASGLPRSIRTLRDPGQPSETYRFEDVVWDQPISRSKFAFVKPGNSSPVHLQTSIAAWLTPPRIPPVIRAGHWAALGNLNVWISPHPRRSGNSWRIGISVTPGISGSHPQVQAMVRLGERWQVGKIEWSKVAKGQQSMVVSAAGREAPSAMRLNYVGRPVDEFVTEWP